MRVSLFVTCLTDNFYPRAGRAVVEVLEHLGCEVRFPEAQTCCGQPVFNSGAHAEARDMAERMVRVFDGDDHVVTPSGSCCAMIHDYYDELLGERGRPFVERTREFVDFLVNVLEVDLRALGCRWPGTATYHYSCHLRGLGMTNEAITLLEQIEGLEVRDLEKSDQCCGFGGTFAVKFPEVSGSMVRDKIDCVRRTGAATLVSNDGGCTLNIEGACARDGMDVRIVHIAEVIAEGLGLMEPPAS